MNRIALTLIVVSVCMPASGQELDVLSWNLESDGNDPAVIASQLAALDHHHLYGLTEVRAENFERYRQAIDDAYPPSFEEVHTKSGGGDRMLIVYDTDRLVLVGTPQELERHEGLRLNFENRDGSLRFRSPLVARFRDRTTETELLFMVNHLARGDSGARREQAKGLREWAKDQQLPVVAVGDYNFDLDFREGENKGNTAFEWFLEDDAWRWVEPDEMIDTNWADSNGTDRYPGTILDFVFLAGPARSWHASSAVVVRPGDFPDDSSTSDHRPVRASLTRTPPAELKEAIAQMRIDLDELESIVDSLRARLQALEQQLPQ
jgi:endonuclease/exonuclease/phosphatase family metal-dependent hydrolase